MVSGREGGKPHAPAIRPIEAARPLDRYGARALAPTGWPAGDRRDRHSVPQYPCGRRSGLRAIWAAAAQPACRAC